MDPGPSAKYPEAPYPPRSGLDDTYAPPWAASGTAAHLRSMTQATYPRPAGCLDPVAAWTDILLRADLPPTHRLDLRVRPPGLSPVGRKELGGAFKRFKDRLQNDGGVGHWGVFELDGDRVGHHLHALLWVANARPHLFPQIAYDRWVRRAGRGADSIFVAVLEPDPGLSGAAFADLLLHIEAAQAVLAECARTYGPASPFAERARDALRGAQRAAQEAQAGARRRFSAPDEDGPRWRAVRPATVGLHYCTRKLGKPGGAELWSRGLLRRIGATEASGALEDRYRGSVGKARREVYGSHWQRGLDTNGLHGSG